MNLIIVSKFIFGFYVFLSLKECFTTASTTISSGGGGTNNTHSSNSTNEDPAVTRFREYLRIPTVHPNPDPGYKMAIEWLRGQANDIGLDFTLINLDGDAEFALWMTWPGSDPSLKSILFNSHMDVVAVQEQNWKYPPFDAFKDANGNIFARGAVDMKCATVGTLEAIRRLKKVGFQPLRTIHVSVIPDEEKGGLKGMKKFVQTKYFKDLNVGIDVDEAGLSSNNNTVAISFAEKSPWQFKIIARGKKSHGSSLPQFTAGQRLMAAINKIFEFREQQFDKLQKGEIIFAELTTVSLVGLYGGIADNIIPSELVAQFDMRIRNTTEWNFGNVTTLLDRVVESGRLGSNDINTVTLEFILKSMETKETVANDSNIWWTVVQKTCRELDLKCPASVISAYTDGRYVRSLDIPAFGIKPFFNTPNTVHMDNEMINEKEFLRGIDVYVRLIKNLALTS